MSDHTHDCPKCGGFFACDRDDCTKEDLCLECQITRLTEENERLKEACAGTCACDFDKDGKCVDECSYHEAISKDLSACRKELEAAQKLAKRRGEGMDALKKLCDEKDGELKVCRKVIEGIRKTILDHKNWFDSRSYTVAVMDIDDLLKDKENPDQRKNSTNL